MCKKYNTIITLIMQLYINFRTDILLKLQQMMQSQWNEALSLLATTPQRKVHLMLHFYTIEGYSYTKITFKKQAN